MGSTLQFGYKSGYKGMRNKGSLQAIRCKQAKQAKDSYFVDG